MTMNVFCGFDEKSPYIALVFWQKVKQLEFNWHLEMNLGSGPVKYQSVVHSGIELLVMISERFKVSDFDHESSKFYRNKL